MTGTGTLTTNFLWRNHRQVPRLHSVSQALERHHSNVEIALFAVWACHGYHNAIPSSSALLLISGTWYILSLRVQHGTPTDTPASRRNFPSLCTDYYLVSIYHGLSIVRIHLSHPISSWQSYFCHQLFLDTINRESKE